DHVVVAFGEHMAGRRHQPEIGIFGLSMNLHDVSYDLSLLLLLVYAPAWNPTNTVFLARPCFLGIMEFSDGTAASALLSGGRRGVELHQGRCAASCRATGVEPTSAGLGGEDRRRPCAPQPARRDADGGGEAFSRGSPRAAETR